MNGTDKGFPVSLIWEDAKDIVGTCTEPVLFRKISGSIEVLANTGDFDPLFGVVDICVEGDVITLPREIGTPLTINVQGNPAIPRSQHHEFHLNGPGSCGCSCEWAWVNQGLVPTYRRLIQPSKLISFVNNQADEGSLVRAYGYEAGNNPVRTEVNGVWEDGYRIPTAYGYAMPDANAPTFSRVTRLTREKGEGSIRISTYDNSSTTGTLLANLHFDETEPRYRQITLERSADWVRVRFRRSVLRFYDTTDWIPLPSSEAVIQMLRAKKAYDEDRPDLGAGYEATARRYLTEANWANRVPDISPITIMDTSASQLHNKSDSLD